MTEADDEIPSRTLPLELPPGITRSEEPPPTKPDASPRMVTTMPPAAPSTLPPPPGAEYFDRAYKQLLVVHEEQKSRYEELHDDHGPLARLYVTIDLVLFEVRLIRSDFGSVLDRLGKLEKRADDADKRLRRLEGLGADVAPSEPPPAG